VMPNSSSRAELATIEATEGPAFSEPWQAQAFALVLALHEQGLFAWSEWAEYLTAAIADAQNKRKGEADRGESYYEHWLTALERLAKDKGYTPLAELTARKAQWHAAYLNTPHGQAISLDAARQETP